MTLAEAAHEASKLLGAGFVISMGIFAEEAIAAYLKPLGPQLSEILSVVTAGILTGLGSLLVVFMLDRIDLFGVNAKDRHKFIIGELNKQIDEDMAVANEIIERRGLLS